MSSTMAENDRRFKNKDQAFLKSTAFPPSFSAKVDLRKVNLNVFRPWVVKRTEEMLGFEDEVVVELVMGQLEDTRSPDPRQIQSLLQGFLASHTAGFTEQLWELLLSAQQSQGGVPVEFVEAKKRELREQDERDRNAASGRFRGPPAGTVAPAYGGARSGGGGYGGDRGGSRGGPPPGMTRDAGYGARASRFDQPAPPPPRDYGRPSTRDHSPPPARRGRSPSPVERARRASRSPDRYSRSGRDHRPSPPPRRRRSPSRSRTPERYASRRRSPSPRYRRSPSPARGSLRRERSRTPERDGGGRRGRGRASSSSPPPADAARGRARTRSASRGASARY